MDAAAAIGASVLGCLRIEIVVSCEYSSRVIDWCRNRLDCDLRDTVSQGVERLSREIPTAQRIDDLVFDLGVLSLWEFETQFCKMVEHKISRYIEESKLNLRVNPEFRSEWMASIDSGESSISGRRTHARVFARNDDERLLTRTRADAHENRLAIAEACLFSTSRLHLWKTLDRGELHRLLNASDVLTPDMLLLSALRYLHEDAFWDLGKNLLQPEVAVLAISVDGCERALTELFDLPLSRSLLPWLRALWAHEPVRRVMEGRVAFDRVKEIQGVFDEVSFRKGEARKAFNDVPSQARETQRVFDATGSRESEMRRVLNESSFRTREVHPVLLKRTSGGRRCWQECAASSTEIQVNNAGLVLLWPLLPDLLCRLGLRGKDRFIDAQAQTNAACWLDTLIWNDDYAREWRMPFTKWLCGLPLECEIEWQAPDETTTEQLHCWLATLPEQLPGWRTLQVQDIRTLFLQRPGEMLLTETSLKLKVQREPFDILLNDWPWPLNQVMLPWLEQPLMIEWL